MKKTVLLAGFLMAIFLAGCGSQPAQTKTQSGFKTGETVTVSPNENPETYFFKGGKMLIFANGQYTVASGDITLNDGTKVTTGGKVTKTDGSSFQLREGQSIALDGRVLEESPFK